MASTTSVTLQTLIDETLALLYRSSERPAQLTVGSNDLGATSADLLLTLAGDADTISNLVAPALVEIGQEQLLITAKSADATPVFTVSRGYNGTPLSAHVASDVVLISPLWGRFDVRRQILRSLQGAIATQLPSVESTTLTPTANQYFVEAPAACMKALRVAYTDIVNATPGSAFRELSEWDFVDDVPTSVSSTGKLITLPPWVVGYVSEVYLTYQGPYSWSVATTETATAPAETETVDLPRGAEDLPALYAAAYLATGREVSRLQLDKVEEWNNQLPPTSSLNARILQMLWQEFYRRLDETRRLQTVPKHRPFRPMRRG